MATKADDTATSNDDTNTDPGQPQPVSSALTRGAKGWNKTHEAGYQAALNEFRSGASPGQAGAGGASMSRTSPTPTMLSAAPTYNSGGGGAGQLPRATPASSLPDVRYVPLGESPSFGATKTTNPNGSVTTRFASGGTATAFPRSSPEGAKKYQAAQDSRQAPDPSILSAEGGSSNYHAPATRPVYSGSGLDNLPRPVGPTPPVGGTQAVMQRPSLPAVRKQTAVSPRNLPQPWRTGDHF